MIDNIKIKLKQGVTLDNACVEIQSYRYTETEVKEVAKGADRSSSGSLVEVELVELEAGEAVLSSVEYQYAVWASKQLKLQGKPHFEIETATLDFVNYQELSQMMNNYAITATETQKFEQVGDKFLHKYLSSEA